MAKYVLISDTTLSREYNNFPLLDFLPCAPSATAPRIIYEFLKGKSPPSDNGRAVTAPYALRKLESALLMKNKPEDVVIAHEDYLEAFIKEDTEIIGVYTMDPLGLGPLTMSYAVLFDDYSKPWVRIEFEALITRVNRARKETKAKLVVGGPGVWELTLMPEIMQNLGIDFAFQGEADDIIDELFEDIVNWDIHNAQYFQGFQSFDDDFHKMWVAHDRFITRLRASKQYPTLEEIPLIRGPTIKGLVEVMRGCGIGCDFCEVTLRPLRYYSPELVIKEVSVNARAGYVNAWLHSDEIFAYEHGPHFTPNYDAIINLFKTAISVKGIKYSNPTHGRISIPAAYPEIVRDISATVRAGPDHWIGVQVGLETGSDRLALIHMPNKTLPLKIGSDGSWQEIISQGLTNMNRYYWRPAFTVQVGQVDETPDDNWETVALVNGLSAMSVDGRPSEFTVIPMQNVPLGLIKSKKFSSMILDESQLAVYYACYRHLMKITLRDSIKESKGNIVKRAMMSSILGIGSFGLLQIIEIICKKRGLDVEKIKRYGLSQPIPVLAK
jgi:radical SAM superfamily enzyme YgiQ (UPF0313 family)